MSTESSINSLNEHFAPFDMWAEMDRDEDFAYVVVVHKGEYHDKIIDIWGDSSSFIGYLTMTVRSIISKYATFEVETETTLVFKIGNLFDIISR